MSKYVKNLITDYLRQRLADVDDALVVDVVGLDAGVSNRLRTELQSKDISLMVVKNSLAARATEGTPLGPMFEGLRGTAAVCWGSEDVVGLAREVTRLTREGAYEGFRTRGGVMEGEQLSSEQVVAVSKWPSRQEQLSLLLGQILGPGTDLMSQLTGPASALAGQIDQKAEKSE